MERAFHVAGSQGWISAPNLAQRRPLFEHFQDEMNHNARSFETRFPMANFRMYPYVLVNQIFHKILSSQIKVYHGFTLLSRMLSPLFSRNFALTPVPTGDGSFRQLNGFESQILPRASISRSAPWNFVE